jgi:hypothetical protein
MQEESVMDTALPTIAFTVMIIAQFAAVIAVQIQPLADFFPRLQPDHSPQLRKSPTYSTRRIGHA